MAFAEDLSIFLSTSDFAVPVVAGAISGLGILDMLSEIIADKKLMTTRREQILAQISTTLASTAGV